MPEIKDKDLLSEIKDRAADLKASYGARNGDFEKYEEMYRMEWNTEAPDDADIIISPDARNSVIGAVRLVTATDPIINIRPASIEEDYRDLEEFIRVSLEMVGRIGSVPLHHELVLSALLYAEMHTAITLTSDLLAAAKKTGKGVARFERIAATTPWMFTAWNPKHGYPEMGDYGMTGYYREVETTVRRVMQDYGHMVSPEFANKKGSEKVKLSIWYDDDYKAVWVDSEDILLMEHGFPVIPVQVQITDGSFLFSKPEEQRAPLLYTLMKSKLWEQQSAALSAIYYYTKNMAAVPLMVHKAGQNAPGKRLNIEYSEAKPYGVVELEPEEDFSIIQNKGIIDPALMEGYNISRRLSEESTIFKAALGAPPEQQSTFSELALLATSGRLPLVGTQKRGGWGLSNVLEAALLMLRAQGGKAKTFGREIKASDIPEVPMVDVKLDIKLPEDQLQKANIAMMLVKGNPPLASVQWVQENVMQITDTDAMQEQIWAEQAANLQAQQYFQQMMMAQQQAGMPTEGAPGLAPEGMPDEQMMTAGPGMLPGQGETIQGGLPPQMAGMIPGAGQGMAPQGPPPEEV